MLQVIEIPVVLKGSFEKAIKRQKARKETQAEKRAKYLAQFCEDCHRPVYASSWMHKSGCIFRYA